MTKTEQEYCHSDRRLGIWAKANLFIDGELAGSIYAVRKQAPSGTYTVYQTDDEREFCEWGGLYGAGMYIEERHKLKRVMIIPDDKLEWLKLRVGWLRKRWPIKTKEVVVNPDPKEVFKEMDKWSINMMKREMEMERWAEE